MTDSLLSIFQTSFGKLVWKICVGLFLFLSLLVSWGSEKFILLPNYIYSFTTTQTIKPFSFFTFKNFWSNDVVGNCHSSLEVRKCLDGLLWKTDSGRGGGFYGNFVSWRIQRVKIQWVKSEFLRNIEEIHNMCWQFWLLDQRIHTDISDSSRSVVPS